MLCLGGPESSKNLILGSPKLRCLRLGGALRLGVGVSSRIEIASFGHFHRNSLN